MTNPLNPGLHRFAVFTACCTFLLLVAGALVTSNDAGLSVPDWPLSYGSLAPPWVGGIRYEHGHRMIAASVGLLTIILAVWLARSEPRRWVRRLGYVALAAVIAQGLLGGLTVLFFLPARISVAHACLAQIFFGAVVSLAMFTSQWWQSDQSGVEDSGSPSLRWLAAMSVAAVFVQLLLGAALRHNAIGIVPHLVGAAVVTLLVFWTAGALRRRYPGHALFRACGTWLHVLVGAQLALGGAAYWSRLVARGYPQPIPVMVWLTVAHTAMGAIILAGTLVVALVCYRLIAPASRKALAAQAGEVNAVTLR